MLMSAAMDAELDAPGRGRLEAHLSTCASCAQARTGMGAVQAQMLLHVERFAAPRGLTRRLGQALRATPAAPRAWPMQPWGWISLAWAGLSTTGFALLLVLYLGMPSAAQRLDDDIVASHFRSLMSGRPTDVASSDQHTVKPWFAGKLDFSPPVHDLAASGFPLSGARVDFIDHRPVAALVYHRQQHVVTLYVRPDRMQRDRVPRVTSEFGYQLVHWTRSGMQYDAVSDLNRLDLLRLADLLLAQQE